MGQHANGQDRYSRRASLRGIGAAVGGLVLSPAIMACSSRGTTNAGNAGVPRTGGSEPARGGTYSVALEGNPTLDPIGNAGPATLKIGSGVMSRLFRFKTGTDQSTINNHDLENDLALSAESPDALTWTFKLRPEARFQDIPPVSGHPVEAEDIKATFQRALRLPQNSRRGLLDMIDLNQIQSPAPDTLVFTLTYPYASFDTTMAAPETSFIFPREALTGAYHPTKQLIGSGPFTLASGKPDVAYTLQRNPGWFEAGRPYVDALNRPIILDASELLAQFSAGHLDEVGLGANSLDTMQRSNPKATLLKTLPGTADTGLVFFPLGDASSVFQDIRVRRALSMAIDRDAIGRAIFANQYVTSLIAPPSFGKWSLPLSQLDAATQQDYHYNPTEAKRLLQAAGVLDQTFKFAYVTGAAFGAVPWYQQAAPTIRNMFSLAGFKTELVGIDFDKDFIDSGKGYAQGYYPKDTVLFIVDASRTEVDRVVSGDFGSNGSEKLKDAKLGAMIAKARTLVDESERVQAYGGIQKYIAQQVYVLPIGGQYQFRMIQPRVQNYQTGSRLGEGVETYSKVWLKQ